MSNWEYSGFAARGSALAISPDLDALLEADTRRRQARAESPAPSFLSSSSFLQQPQQNSSFQGLPAPPRSRKTYQTQQRPRTANPLSIVHTPSPAREQQEQTSIASTNTILERDSGLDPFLNPTPNIIKPAPTPPIFPSPPPTAQVASSSPAMHNGSEEAGKSSAVLGGVGGSNAGSGGGSRLTVVKGLPSSMFQRARGAFRNESSDSRVRKSDELVQQQQPLHAHHGRNSSSASSGADSDPLSFSNPTSVRSSLDDFTAARISVSSTRYASSDGQHGSDLSHNQPQQSHALVPASSSRSGADYRLLGSQPSIAAPTVLLESSPRAESFIDLVSPPAHKDRYQDLLIQAALPTTTATTLVTPSSSSPVTFYRPLPSLRTANLSPISPPGTSSSSAGRSPIRPLPRIPNLMPRPSSAGPLSRQNQKDKDMKTDAQPMPPTTNHRTERERAELVRKTQKLTQVFGTTPAAQDIAQHVAQTQTQASSSLLAPSAIKRTHPSGAKSLFVRPPTPPGVNTSQDSGNSSMSKGLWPAPADGTQYVSASGRRHSAPLTPEDFSFLSTDGLVPTDESAPGSATTMSFRVSAIEVGSAEGTIESPLDDSFRSSNGVLHAHARLMRGGGRDSLHPADSPDSPHSFMDFGDNNDRSRSPSPPPSATSPASSEDASSMLSVDASHQRKQRKLRKQPGPRGARPSSMRSFSSGKAPSISDSSSLLSALSPTTPSMATPTSALSTADDERRKMRDKLAKLHRFLGSRVPPDLVLGLSPNSLAGLPPIAAIPEGGDDEGGEMDAEVRRSSWRQRRRRSSSAAVPGRWNDDHRALAELDEREKAVVVRRAQKMERMFGVAPPQGLYHSTRPGESSSSNGPPPSSFSPPPSSFSFRTPAQEIQAKAQARPLSPSSSPNSPRSPRNTNVNQSAYTKLGGRSASGGKRKSGRHYRPGTGDSEEALLGGGSAANADYSSPYGQALHTQVQDHKQTGMSDVYMYYRNSLNSLRDIIDRDDKQSLAQLHEYLTSEDPDGDDMDSPEPNVLAYANSKYGPSGSTHNTTTSPTEMSPLASGAMFSPSTPRRHSLPARASMSSLASEYTIAPPAPDPQAFAQRRRRAAKLAAFFGTSYKELVGEVLESIATGLRDEQGAGRLNDDEMRDLLRNVETIRHREFT